jgi:glycosyltransferase involved in cell wall biosynthesis
VLKIGYLIQQFPPEVGAGPARALEMARRWIAQGAGVTVFTGMPNRPEGRIHPEYRGRLFQTEQWEGIRVRRSWLYASPDPGFGRTILNNVSFMTTSALHGVVSSGGLDVLIASSPPFFSHLTGKVIASTHRVPLVLEVRDLWPDYLIGLGAFKRDSVAARGLLALERYVLRRADAIAAVTESFRARIRDKGVADDRIEVLPNGVDPSFYYRDNSTPGPIPDLDRRNGEMVVGYLGNMGAGQGLESVLHAADRLRENTPRIRFALVGDGPARSRLQELADSLQIPGLSLYPPIRKEQTRAFYNACDLMLVPLAPVPIFQETIPSKLFEILACECPVLASVAGEAQRVVERSRGGWTVPPGDPVALANGITKALATPAPVREQMGRSGRSFVRREYDRAAIADRYLALLSRVGGKA